MTTVEQAALQISGQAHENQEVIDPLHRKATRF